MQLQLCTWQDVETYLQRSTGIIVPIGSTEQHGPMGLIGTDAICPEVIARRVGDETGALVGPTISVGMSQHHLAFPGSITLRPSTLVSLICDYVTSLARNGFRRFYFLNGHGGNIASVGAAFSEIYAATSLTAEPDGTPVRCKLASWWAFDPVGELSKSLYGDREGSHATPSEVSVTQHAYPDSIRSMDPVPAETVPRKFHDAADFRRLFPDGRMGSDSFLATPEHGRQLVEAAAAAVGQDYSAFVSEE